MKLTREEQEMLEGKLGYPVQRSMEILVSLGECYDAERMVPVGSVHLPGCHLNSAGKAGAAFVQEMADKGGKFIPFTDTNITGIDPELWREFGIPEDFYRDSLAHSRNFERMGAFAANTCTPFFVGHVPRMGQHVAWGESSAVIFVNSFFGARTNREGAPSALAAAFTGRVPEYGYHLDENRYGDLKVVVEAKLNDVTDYGTLGYFTGKLAGDRVPVFAGISPSASGDELKMLGSAIATSGSAALFHAVGVTPEAPTEKAAFGTKKAGDSQTFVFGEKELKATEEMLTKATLPEVDVVAIGCPNCSISEIKDVAVLLAGKKVKSEFWVMAPRALKTYAQKMGYLGPIEASGARMMCEVCSASLPQGLLKKRGFKTAVTNSAKMSYYISGSQEVLPYYGSLKRCVRAAISGVWR